MSANSKIEWTDHTFNPWIGCTKVSPACDNCYAERSTPSRTLGVVWGPTAPRHRTSPGNWAMPLRWNAQHEAFFQQHGRRQRVFCASLADVFDNQVPGAWRVELLQLIADTPNLDWLLLSKRIGNAHQMLNDALSVLSHELTFWEDIPWPNVWLGATVVNQEEADRDIPKLLAVPAAKRFLSMEPLLGPVDLAAAYLPCPAAHDGLTMDPGTGAYECCRACDFTGIGSEMGIDWVIVGGESGPSARPMHPDWVRSLRDQCQAAGVPFLFKQWGKWLPISQMPNNWTDHLYKPRIRAKPHEDQAVLDDIYGRDCTVENAIMQLDGSLHAITAPMAFQKGAMQTFKVGKKAAGRLLDGRIWDETPIANAESRGQ